MDESMDDIMHPGTRKVDPDFPHAPRDWSREQATDAARREGLELTEDHWTLIRALQNYFSTHTDEQVRFRELHDALDESFHGKGGIRYLYKLFPGGPVAQGCRFAGIEPPAGAVDKSFGSVA